MVYIKLEKTDMRILLYIVKDISKEYSIKELADQLKKPYVKVHSSIQRMIKRNIIKKKVLGKSHYCRFDYKNNLDIACFVESQKARDFTNNNKPVKIFLDNLKNKLTFPDYSLVIFGSFAKNTQIKNSDLDLAIITSKQNLRKTELIINALAKIINIQIHSVEFSYKDFIEMLKSKELNVAKEIIKNHIIIHGCEQFYESIDLSE